MQTWKMAYRNIGRNRRRTIITVSAAAFALLIMIAYAGLMRGMIVGMEKNVTALQISDIQIHAPEYLDEPSLYTRIEDPDAVVRSLDENGFFAAPRLIGFGLVSSGPSSAGTQIVGVDPVRETQVVELHRHLKEGQWLDRAAPRGVVIGNKMAVSLGVSVGSELVFVSQAADGSIANDLYTVRGILKTVGAAVDRSTVFMLDSAFRDVMYIPEGVHEIAVKRPGGMELAPATELAASLAPGLDVQNWKMLLPAINEMFESWDSMMVLLFGIFYIAVALTILNAMLMSVFERVREFGVLKAIGLPPFSVFRLILAEATLQIGIAVVIGTIVGVALSLRLETHGIDLTGIAGEATISGIAIDPVWKSITTVDSVTQPILLLVIIGLLGVMYPAIKAGVIQPLKAIHHR